MKSFSRKANIDIVAISKRDRNEAAVMRIRVEIFAFHLYLLQVYLVLVKIELVLVKIELVLVK